MVLSDLLFANDKNLDVQCYIDKKYVKYMVE